MSDALIVILGSLVILVFVTLFSFAARPKDFRRPRTRTRKRKEKGEREGKGKGK